MLKSKAAVIAANIANQCLELIMRVEQKDGSTIDRNPEQVALIGKIIKNAIAATKPQNMFEAMTALKTPIKKQNPEEDGDQLEASTD